MSMYFVQLRIAPQNPKTPQVNLQYFSINHCCTIQIKYV